MPELEEGSSILIKNEAIEYYRELDIFITELRVGLCLKVTGDSVCPPSTLW